jgi:hypothetical protein
MVMKPAYKGTGQQSTRLDITIPMISGNDRGLAKRIATVQDYILFAGTDFREKESIHPSHKRFARRVRTLVKIVILLKWYQRWFS